MWRTLRQPSKWNKPMTDQKVVLITGAPVGFEARLLSRLRRFMPAGPIDRSVRKAFALI
jgi:hypothetical protein